jgi:gliding motility-associated-like protein
LAPGAYKVSVTDAHNCFSSDTFRIREPEKLTIDSKTIEHPYCPRSKDGNIRIDVSGGTGSYTYEWYNLNDHTINNHHGDYVAGLDKGTYFVQVSDAHHCVAYDTAKLTLKKETCFNIPTAFSPNHDGVNDTWRIPKLSDMFPDCRVYVYDRWGELVFKSKGYKEPWNGRYRGHPLPETSYHFIIKLRTEGRLSSITGQVTIIR